MSVLKGEGKVPILFGSTSIAAGSRTQRGYLARPDLAGEWPTVVVVASAWGVTSSVKDVCRRLARQGLAVVAPDLYHGAAPSKAASPQEAWDAAAALAPAHMQRDLDAIVSFVQNTVSFWSSAERAFGILGLGSGGACAAGSAVRHGAAALGLVTAPLDGLDEALVGFSGAVTALFGREDDRVDVATVGTLRDVVPQAEMAIYAEVGSDFLDDSRPVYDREVAADALERLVEMFLQHLPPAPA